MACKNAKDEEMKAKRRKALEYFQSNGVPKVLEDLLNTMYHENPDDLWGYLSNYFQKFAKPALLSKLHSELALDGRALPAIALRIYCFFWGSEKLISTSLISLGIRPLDDDTFRLMTDYINGPLNSVVAGRNVVDIGSLDDRLGDVFRRRLASRESTLLTPSDVTEEKMNEKTDKKEGSVIVFKRREGKLSTTSMDANPVQGATKEVYLARASYLLSIGLWRTGAILRDLPMYQYISVEKEKTPRLPLLMVSLISRSRMSAGKLNMITKAGLVFNTSLSMAKMLELLRVLSEAALDVQLQKFGSSSVLVDEGGCLVPTFDRMEQPLEFLQEVLNLSGYTSREDLTYFIACCPDDYYDAEKGRYEITKGTFKNVDELVDVYSSMFKTSPGLSHILNPFGLDNSMGWSKLASKLSGSPLPSPESGPLFTLDGSSSSILRQLATKEIEARGVLVHPYSSISLTEMRRLKEQLAEQKPDILLGLVVPSNDVNDDSIIDLAVGLQMDFVFLPGLYRGEMTAKINRFLRIKSDLPQVEMEPKSTSSPNVSMLTEPESPKSPD